MTVTRRRHHRFHHIFRGHVTFVTFNKIQEHPPKDGRSLARELLRARVSELMDMKNKLEQIGTNLESILKLQMELLSRIEEEEESSYALASDVDSANMFPDLSFGVLLELAVHKLNGNTCI
ncbi:hypothetical protein F441_15620 [Phytophthora nicotianae CJ01A1]|uniref:Uncharacterized protein n=1 Tax=Phytophthora nicotianae CJ01A1 TaxID=1317063 RepID=W2WFL9_PHYNI|nr:hypothetical protein F441_15620 [Phytophthora nicotianae CJ01A1]